MDEAEHEDVYEVGRLPNIPVPAARVTAKRVAMTVGPAAAVLLVVTLAHTLADTGNGSAHGKTLPPPGHGTATVMATAMATASAAVSGGPSGSASSGPSASQSAEANGVSPATPPGAPDFQGGAAVGGSGTSGGSGGTGGGGGPGGGGGGTGGPGSNGGTGSIGGPVPTTPPPTTAHPTNGPRMEEAYNRHGVPTFSDPTKVTGKGTTIAFMAEVLVSCKLYDPSIPSVTPSGYWYRIQSAPWNGAYYAAANTFLNGDPPAGPYTHTVDDSVPDC